MQARAVALSVTTLSLLVAGSALAAPKPPKHRAAAKKVVSTTTTTVAATARPEPTTTTRSEPTTTTTTRTEPAHTEPAPTTTVRAEPARPQTVDARGKISSLRGDGLSVTRENGTTLSCRYAPDQAASIAAGAPLGTSVRITCSLDGTGYRLATIDRV
jgi:hypothetical protein